MTCLTQFQPLVDEAMSGEGDSNPDVKLTEQQHDEENQENEAPTQN